jgi:hypothetical protein
MPSHHQAAPFSPMFMGANDVLSTVSLSAEPVFRNL